MIRDFFNYFKIYFFFFWGESKNSQKGGGASLSRRPCVRHFILGCVGDEGVRFWDSGGPCLQTNQHLCICVLYYMFQYYMFQVGRGLSVSVSVSLCSGWRIH
jgi:hypothetical protein